MLNQPPEYNSNVSINRISILPNKIILEAANRKDVNLNIIYTDFYFKTINLEPTDENIMTGGYFQKTEDLTIPFKYIVWLVEKNPITLGINTLFNKTGDIQTPSTDIFKTIKNYLLPNKSTTPILENKTIQESPVLENKIIQEPPVLENKIIQEPPVLENKIIQEPPILENKIIQEPPILENQIIQESPVLENKTIQEPPILENEEVKTTSLFKNNELPTDQYTQIINTPPLDDSQINKNIKIEFIIEHDIENNGKSLKEILKECKESPRTIETIDESGITYLLLEKIVFDLYSQITFLNINFNTVYSEFREEFIYNINGNYVLFDTEKITYLGNDKINISGKTKENNKIFSDFIQKLKFGEATFFQTTNDTIIENTNVEKLKKLLS